VNRDLMFRSFLTPSAEQPERVVALARLTEQVGLDLVSVQDHPYQARFLDTWTLLSVIAASTSTVTVAPNVANLPLRPPAVLARSVATLDLLSQGRVELGAGGFVEAADRRDRRPEAQCGPRRRRAGGGHPDHPRDVGRVRWHGTHRRRASPGLGRAPRAGSGARCRGLGRAYKKRMLGPTGRLADGWLPSSPYAAPDELPAMNRTIDEAAEQGRTTDGGAAAAVTGQGRTPRLFADGLRVTPTPDAGVRLSDQRVWDESSRPSAPAPDPDRAYTAHEQASGQHLVDVHDGLRAELARMRDLIDQVTAGRTDPAAARDHINQLMIRQNNWTVGTYCESYCRVVTTHHTLEDRSVFPHLRDRDPRLAPVIDRLQQEHVAIQGVLEQVDRALVAFVSAPDRDKQLRAAADLLTDTLLSHLAYEERELVEPLARLGFY
jgi:alkanesulfonate monooxygenase SsuD/methylene tetrahydromethanopterin reductase-like flavin-dependent oxidoreductase (luciferase family)